MAGAGALLSLANLATANNNQQIQGFEDKGEANLEAWKGWKPVSDRKIQVGIAGYGVCKFGAAFSFQDHPNVEVVAVTDLIPKRCAALAKACKCEKTYPSCEEMIKDDGIEAIFVATDAPSHADLCIAALEAGKHVACAVPAVFGSIKDADRLFNAVKKSGKKYMMFETSYYHADLHAWRQPYNAGELGKLVYSEGKTGRIRGQKEVKSLVETKRPPLPPGMKLGGHGGSHSHLTNEFIESILMNRKPLVDIAQSLAMTVAGIVAHQSALKNGELLKIPQYKL